MRSIQAVQQGFSWYQLVSTKFPEHNTLSCPIESLLPSIRVTSSGFTSESGLLHGIPVQNLKQHFELNFQLKVLTMFKPKSHISTG